MVFKLEEIINYYTDYIFDCIINSQYNKNLTIGFIRNAICYGRLNYNIMNYSDIIFCIQDFYIEFSSSSTKTGKIYLNNIVSETIFAILYEE